MILQWDFQNQQQQWGPSPDAHPKPRNQPGPGVSPSPRLQCLSSTCHCHQSSLTTRLPYTWPEKNPAPDSSSVTPVTSSSRGHLFPLKNGVSEGTIFSPSRSSQCLIYQLIKSTARLGGADAEDKTHQAAAPDRRSRELWLDSAGLSSPSPAPPGIPTSALFPWLFLDISHCSHNEISGFVFILFSGNASFSSSLRIGALSLQTQILAPPRKCGSCFARVRFSEFISV